MSYKPFADDVLFLGRVAIRRGAQNGYVLTSDADGNATWQAASGGGATWGSITGTLSSQTDLQSALDAKQNESIVINSNTTAVLDGVYTVVASATFTDPTPAEGKGFMVFVRNGTATVGGTAYSVAGTIINRIYHSGAWANYPIASNTLNTTWELVDTRIASSSAVIDFTGLNSTYTTYKILVSNFVPATNNTILGLRVGTGGTPTYQSGASDYSWIRSFAVITGPFGGGANTDNKILIGSNGGQSNSATRGYASEITIVNPSQTTDNHAIMYQSFSTDSGGGYIYQAGGGLYLSTTAVTAIRIFMNTGNIASGTFKLYGIR